MPLDVVFGVTSNVCSERTRKRGKIDFRRLSEDLHKQQASSQASEINMVTQSCTGK